MATKAVEIDGEEYNGFASEFKWYFHSWTDYNKIREYTRRGRTVEFDPGVPMDKVGSGTDTDYHRVTRRLIEAPNRRAGQDKVEATLGQDLLLVNSVKYHINPTNIGQHREILSWLDLLNLIQIPPEVEEQLNEITNNLELELILDIIAEYEEIDILPDLPVEAWWETTVEKLGDLGQTFSQCDP